MFKVSPVVNSVNLSIHPVLEQGYIVYAHASHGDDTRIVSIEDPIFGYKSAEPTAQRPYDTKSHVGTGATTADALRQALQTYYGIDADYQPTKDELGHQAEAALIAQLDDWIIAHNGNLRAVCDFDGTVLLRLEGTIDPFDMWSEQVVLDGAGMTFYDALDAVFVTTTTLIFKNNQEDISQSITTSTEPVITVSNMPTTSEYFSAIVPARTITVEKRQRVSQQYFLPRSTY